MTSPITSRAGIDALWAAANRLRDTGSDDQPVLDMIATAERDYARGVREAILAAKTCKDAGMGKCERKREGQGFCPGGRCLRYDYADGETWWDGELAALRLERAQ